MWANMPFGNKLDYTYISLQNYLSFMILIYFYACNGSKVILGEGWDY